MERAVTISSMGLTTSLGAGAEMSCAGARAGISRLSPLPGLGAFDEEEGEVVPLYGNVAAGGVASSFSGVGRLVELARVAMNDLFSNLGGHDFAGGVIALIAVGGEYYLRRFYENELEGVEALEIKVGEIVEAESASFKSRVNAQLLPRLAAKLPFELDVDSSEIVFGEQASVASLLDKARQMILSGRAEQVIVGGVDCLVDETRSQQLNQLGLLKSQIVDAGFFPGEAAAFVLLQSASKDTAGPCLGPVTCLAGESHRFAETLPQGTELAEVIKMVVDEAGEAIPDQIIFNLNGDQWQSWDLGSAYCHLGPDLSELTQLSPAVSFGEIGSATMTAGIIMAACGQQRGYLGPDSILVCASGNDGSRAAAIVKPMGPSN